MDPHYSSTDNEDKEKSDGIVVGFTQEAKEAKGPSYASRYGAFGRVIDALLATGIEARGVERVPEDERDPKHTWNNFFMWWSADLVLPTIPTGTLAQDVFGLTFPHAVATVLCFGALGAAVTAFIATLGPKTGMRTMIITRYSSGYLGCTIYSIFNILQQVGFSMTCVIVGGQTLASIDPGSLPLVVGIIIVSVCSLVPCFIGYDFVHLYERYAWTVMLIIMLILFILGAKAGFDITAHEAKEDTGVNLAGNILSYGGVIYGSFAWAPVAADFNCRLPATISSTKVFLLTFFGLFIPITFVEILGAALMTITDPAYTSAFENGGTGGLLSQVLSPWKAGGKIVLVLLALSCVATNIPCTYSAGLSIQALGRPFARVPRFLWTFLVCVIYTIAGVIGREHLSEILSNFLSIISYWTAFFVAIIAVDHFVFRRKGGPLGGYDLEVYNDRNKLPLGIAGISAACCGVAGAIVGMAEVWYVGPIAAKFGHSRGDLGFELSALFTAVSYLPLRWLEIRLTGR